MVTWHISEGSVRSDGELEEQSAGNVRCFDDDDEDLIHLMPCHWMIPLAAGRGHIMRCNAMTNAFLLQTCPKIAMQTNTSRGKYASLPFRQ